ncbi:MAG TPA: permease prefix domain 2-containing transporter [Pyrinomonadaceae bacterium]|jgi:hypothetical protein
MGVILPNGRYGRTLKEIIDEYLYVASQQTKAYIVATLNDEANRLQQSKNVNAHPPATTEYILCLFLNADQQDAIIGDLTERYMEKYELLGKRKAKYWFIGQVLGSMPSLLFRSVVRTITTWLRKPVR